MLVRVEHDVGAIRHVVRVHGHAFQIVGSIYKDTNLGIVGTPQIEVGHTTAKFDDAILRGATFITITDLHPAGVNAGRILPFIPGCTPIGRVIVADRLDDV